MDNFFNEKEIKLNEYKQTAKNDAGLNDDDIIDDNHAGDDANGLVDESGHKMLGTKTNTTNATNQVEIMNELKKQLAIQLCRLLSCALHFLKGGQTFQYISLLVINQIIDSFIRYETYDMLIDLDQIDLDKSPNYFRINNIHKHNNTANNNNNNSSNNNGHYNNDMDETISNNFSLTESILTGNDKQYSSMNSSTTTGTLPAGAGFINPVGHYYGKHIKHLRLSLKYNQWKSKTERSKHFNNLKLETKSQSARDDADKSIKGPTLARWRKSTTATSTAATTTET